MLLDAGVIDPRDTRAVLAMCLSICREVEQRSLRPMQLTHEHHEIQRTLKRFIDDEINPHVDEWEAAEIFPAHQVFKQLGNLGLLGLTKPEAYGGAGLDYSYAVVMAETLGHIDCGPPAAAMLAVGSKSSAKRLADELGLPGWHGDDQGIEHFKTQAQRIGYPLIVKAVAGGGGRGTQAVTGLDPVEWQLRVARGEPLPLQQHEVRFSGHAIEVRLCAEDEMFTPHAGRVQRFVEPRGVRIDHALSREVYVPPHYDSMLAKLIAHAPTRDQAIEQEHRGLSETTLLGLPTNRGLLMECLRHPAFRGGEVRTGFLTEQADTLRARIAAREAECAPLDARAWHVQVGGVDLFIADASFEPAAASSRGGVLGLDLKAPFSGKVVAVHAVAGQAVKAGDALVVVESMKLEHSIAAPRDARIGVVAIGLGQQVSPQQLLLSFEAA